MKKLLEKKNPTWDSGAEEVCSGAKIKPELHEYCFSISIRPFRNTEHIEKTSSRLKSIQISVFLTLYNFNFINRAEK